jgi:hypothetical protein
MSLPFAHALENGLEEVTFLSSFGLIRHFLTNGLSSKFYSKQANKQVGSLDHDQ